MDNEISLSKFISRSMCLAGKDLSKLTHDDVQWLFPNLKRATFEMLQEDPSLLYTGEILLVNDGHRVIPYFNPELSSNLDEYQDFVLETDKSRVDRRTHDYTSMSEYELRQLLRRKFSSAKNQANARKELENRGVVLRRKYDRNKEKRRKFEED